MIDLHFLINILKHLQRGNSIIAIIGVIVFIIQLMFCFVVPVSAQSEVSFSSDDIFEIPSQNGSIRFATSGTYKSANLEDGVLFFKGLYMPDSRGVEKLNLTISATDCYLTVYPYLSAPYSYRVADLRWVILPYTVSGQGTQTFNLGLDPDNSQLDVILDGNFAARNHGWTKDDDGTITIKGSYSNVTLWYIEYPGQPEDASFLNEHYLVIGSMGFLAAIVLLTAVVTHRKKVAEDK